MTGTASSTNSLEPQRHVATVRINTDPMQMLVAGLDHKRAGMEDIPSPNRG